MLFEIEKKKKITRKISLCYSNINTNYNQVLSHPELHFGDILIVNLPRFKFFETGLVNFY